MHRKIMDERLILIFDVGVELLVIINVRCFFSTRYKKIILSVIE